MNGQVIDSYKVYYLNGQRVKSEKLDRDTYDAQAKIIARQKNKSVKYKKCKGCKK